MATLTLIKEAILALKDRTGSSVQAINKWIETEKKVCRVVEGKEEKEGGREERRMIRGTCFFAKT